jgi:hypothetical protein
MEGPVTPCLSRGRVVILARERGWYGHDGASAGAHCTSLGRRKGQSVSSWTDRDWQSEAKRR